jgi:hypothetical protein
MLPNLIRMFERLTGYKFRRVDGERYIFEVEPGMEVAFTRAEIEEEIAQWSTRSG